MYNLTITFEPMSECPECDSCNIGFKLINNTAEFIKLGCKCGECGHEYVDLYDWNEDAE